MRSLITDATAELATVPAAANVGHPGQMTFVGGVTTKFSGHEPDAQTTNPQTWINQALSGPDTNLWYHPNDLGQVAYSELLLAGRHLRRAAGTGAHSPRRRPRRPRDRDAAGRVRPSVGSSGPSRSRSASGSAARTARPAGSVVVRRAHHATRPAGQAPARSRPTAACGCGSAASARVAPGSSSTYRDRRRAAGAGPGAWCASDGDEAHADERGWLYLISEIPWSAWLTTRVASAT